MTTRSFSTIALVGALAALAAGGCGSSDNGKPIPATIRQQLQVQLEEAQARLDNGSPGACADITHETEPDVDRILDQVPDSVDPDVRNALNEGFAHLFELVSNRCDDLQGQQTDTQPDTTEKTTPPPETTETTPPKTDTTPTTPSETETTPQQPTTPDNGNGNGNGGSGGGVKSPGDVGGGSTPPGEG